MVFFFHRNWVDDSYSKQSEQQNCSVRNKDRVWKPRESVLRLLFWSFYHISFNYLLQLREYVSLHEKSTDESFAPQRSGGTESRSVNASDIGRMVPARQQSGKVGVEGSQNCHCDCVCVHHLLFAYGDRLSLKYCWSSSSYIAMAVHLYRFLLILNSVLNPVVYNTFLPGFSSIT